jgi:hypothetical protein
MLEENTQPQVEEQETQVVEEVTEVQEETPARELVKVKHLHEEKEIDPYTDEGKAYIQKGMDYERIKTKYESSKSASDFVESLARQQGMNVDEYMKAVNDHQRQQEIESLATANGLNNEMAEELYLLRQERKQREVRESELQAKERQNQEYMDFFKEFPDVSAEQIPNEVFEFRAKNPNTSLVDAYVRHQYNQMINKNKTQEVNEKNAKTATGSVTGNGEAKTEYITKDAFEKNRHDKNWVRKNYEKLIKSRPKW